MLSFLLLRYAAAEPLLVATLKSHCRRFIPCPRYSFVVAIVPLKKTKLVFSYCHIFFTAPSLVIAEYNSSSAQSSIEKWGSSTRMDAWVRFANSAFLACLCFCGYDINASYATHFLDLFACFPSSGPSLLIFPFIYVS